MDGEGSEVEGSGLALGTGDDRLGEEGRSDDE